VRVSGDSAIIGKGACNELSSHSYMYPRIAVAGHVFEHSFGGLAVLAKSRHKGLSPVLVDDKRRKTD